MIDTQPNEKRCTMTRESHTLKIQGCCPVSQNPQQGSKITITYIPEMKVLEVSSLRSYINSYIGGKGEIRSMEGMIQNIAKDCAIILGVGVDVTANLLIEPDQEMILECKQSRIYG